MPAALLELLARSRVFDLSQPYYVGMPHHPAHAPYLYGMTKGHGDILFVDGASSASEAIALGAHVGTHIDALCHFSKDGLLHGGFDAEAAQTWGGGLDKHGVETIEPIVRRGVMLDVAAAAGMDALEADTVIGPEVLERAAAQQGVDLREDDVALLRTGWARRWADARAFHNGGRAPGPGLEGARWLSERGIFAGGSDTVAFEFQPDPRMPVHVHFLVEQGIHILEALDLEPLAQAGVHEFAFVAAPLKIVGGTGAPIRPLALA
ncbi:MAG: cyclase family protein [Acidobacteria bacterium]|nr:cyclase family protein [Acidobacteriota bacterium]